MARTTKQRPPAPQAENVSVKKPPEVIRSEGITGTLAMILPMFGTMGMMAVMALSSNRSPRMLLMSGAFMVAMLGVAGLNIYRNRKQHRESVEGSRREYLAYLANVRKNARLVEGQQRDFTQWFLPHPADLVLIAAEGTRVGEREPSDDEFLMCRLGSADQPFSMTLMPEEESQLAEADPVAESARARLMKAYDTLDDLPLGLDMQSAAKLQIIGSADSARGLARAITLHYATFNDPENLQIAVLTTDDGRADWDWVKWLGHTESTRQSDGLGPVRMVVTDPLELIDLLPDDLAERPRFMSGEGGTELPHILIINDGVPVPPDHPFMTPDGVLGISVIELPTSWDVLLDSSTIRLDITGPILRVQQVGYEEVTGRADSMSTLEAAAVARRLARPISRAADVETDDGASAGEPSSEITDLLGLGHVRELDVATAWRPRLNRDKLRVPIGLTSDRKPVYLDIKESAQQGMGPHGLIIGATGSGKSEVLRTLVLALALTHSSEDLNFVLVDFKGGATFAGMAELPHVSAIITNLGDDLTLVDRMEDALRGEMARRQELLSSAGNYKNVQDYEKARRDGRHSGVPLPTLMIVVDEFSELLSEKPDFADMFVAIGRLGRSLSIHLLLSSQRLEESRMRGLDSHLSYRIGLRTFSAAESRTVLGVGDAYELPPIPGVGYLKADQSSMTRFRAAYVSGPPPRQRLSQAGSVDVDEGPQIEIYDFTSARVEVEEPEVDILEDVEETEDLHDDDSVETTFDIAVARLEGQGPLAHKVWLDPLDVPTTLNALMPDLVAHSNLGLVSPGWRNRGGFTIPIGEVDLPFEQRRDTYFISLSGAAGHGAVVGGPQSGKSTVMRTMLVSLALTNTPREAHFYVMDFGGGGFGTLRDMAHMAGIASRNEPDRVRRMFAEIVSIVDDRERFFSANGIDSMETYRRRREAGEIDDGYGDIFLFIDGWATLRSDFSDIEEQIEKLLPRGLNYGVHIIVSALRWTNIRPAIKDMLGARVEMRLGDPLDSEIDRKVAKLVPTNRPGRGLTMNKHHMLVALPRIDGERDPNTVSAGQLDLVAMINEAWRGAPAPKMRELPEHVSIDALRASVGPGDRRVLLGLNESRLEPFGIDFSVDDHFYFFGGQQSGKTATMRLIASEIARVYQPHEAQMYVVDFRRTLLGDLPEGHLSDYFTTEAQASDVLGRLAKYLETRRPGPDVTPRQLRERSWWQGAEVFILVDDYDLVTVGGTNPLDPLIPLLPQARDLGLHVILARRTGGASRSLYERTVQTFAELSVPGMLLPGPSSEGRLIGGLAPRDGNPGRAQFVSRDIPREALQIAWQPSTLDSDEQN
ncbi:type VII secretion protein EccCa [Trueperella sp.]|uniref:type VII secretion protein EccCa n=1 Tax=Trueperella sp. TaxID=2699835 RepID=UPI003735404B